MPKQKHTFNPQTPDWKAGTHSTAKKYEPYQTNWSQQRSFLNRVAPGGGPNEFEAKYQQHQHIGSGGFGFVFAGVRKSDHLPVAIKHIPKENLQYIPVIIQGQLYNIPQEVFLMVKAAGGPERLGQSAAVTLLQWFDLSHEILLVMERPVPSIDLFTFSLVHQPLPEDLVKDIVKQLVSALIDLHSRRIFHRDIKLNNILIQTLPDGLRVRIIDFGCGCTVMSIPYESYSGTLSYAPPELFLKRKYSDIMTSVWQLGALTYELLENYTNREFSTIEWITGNQPRTRHVSDECTDFLNACLEVDTSKRLTLDQMYQHPWLLGPTTPK